MDGKGTYPSCPACGNKAHGAKIRRCDGCKHVFCEACEGHVGYDNPTCPKCDQQLLTLIGDHRYRILGSIG